MMLPYDGSFGAWTVCFSSLIPQQYSSYQVVTTVVLGILLLKVLVSKKKNLPPGPRGLPIIGALHLVGKHPRESLAKLAETYGPVMSLWFGQKLTVVASSPAAAEEFLKNQDTNFSSRPTTTFGEFLLPNNILMKSDTPVTLHLKKILHMQLSTTKQLQQSKTIRAEEIAHVFHMIPLDGTGTVAPLRTYILVVVTNILSRLILNKRSMAVAGTEDGLVHEHMRKFNTITAEIARCSLQIDVGDFIPMLKRFDIQGFRRHVQNVRQQADAFMSNIVSEHLVQRKSGSLSEKDMVDVLLDQVEDKTLRFDITDQHVNSVLWDGFVAGTISTTDAIEWAMAECIHSPSVMSKAQAELDAVVGKSRRVEDADIPNLKYLQAIIKETFRLHISPAVLFPHVNKNACTVFGYDIPAGTSVFVNAGAIARDASIWEDPLKFKPERFLDGPHASTDVQGKHFELLSFGSGRRGCPGMALGIAVVRIMTATLLQSFDWSLPAGLQPMDLDMSEAPGMINERAQPLIAIPKARLSISPIVD